MKKVIAGTLKRRKCKDIALNELNDFVSLTSLHGPKKLVDEIDRLNQSLGNSSRKSFAAKFIVALVWSGSFVIGISLIIILNSLVWMRKGNTPTLTTIDTYYHPIYEVPFPAVTLCNVNVVYRPALRPTIDKLIKMGYTEHEVLEFTSHFRVLVKPRKEIWPKYRFEMARDLHSLGFYIENLMLEVMQPCTSMIRKCIWYDQPIPCDQLFLVSKAPEGFCCSFNSQLAMRRHNLNASREYRLSGVGEFVALDLLLAPDVKEYVSYHKSYYGIDMYIHPRENYADTGFSIPLRPGYHVNVGLTPSVLVSDESVRTLPQDERDCLFPDESKSLINDKYTYVACMTDCRVRGFIEHCNCVPFYFYHTELPEFKHIQVCNFSHVECTNQIRTIISSTEPPPDSPAFAHARNRTHIGLNCDCRPGCHEVRYEQRVHKGDRRKSQYTIDQDAFISKFKFPAKDMLNYTTVSITFESTTCIKYRRSIYMTWDDLIGSFGAIFGLCIGGSIISLTEVVYFMLTRTVGRIFFHRVQQTEINHKVRSIFTITK